MAAVLEAETVLTTAPVETDFSIDYNLIKNAQDLLGNKRVSPQVALEWIHSPTKEHWERALIGAVGKQSFPLARLAMRRVRAENGSPVIYRTRVGFLGENNEVVKETVIRKIRTMHRGVDANERPQETTVSKGTRKTPPTPDTRIYSRTATLLRRTGFDELPQLWDIQKGRMAGVGLRGYTRNELIWLTDVFANKSNGLPDYLRWDYRQTVTRVQPDPSFFGLESATLGKDLTPSERLLLNLLYLLGANPLGDAKIVMASFFRRALGTGVR